MTWSQLATSYRGKNNTLTQQIKACSNDNTNIIEEENRKEKGMGGHDQDPFSYISS